MLVLVMRTLPPSLKPLGSFLLPLGSSASFRWSFTFYFHIFECSVSPRHHVKYFPLSGRILTVALCIDLPKFPTGNVLSSRGQQDGKESALEWECLGLCPRLAHLLRDYERAPYFLRVPGFTPVN